MAIVETRNFIKSLIQTGADASLNLFEVSFLLANNKDLKEYQLSVRTTHFGGVITRDSNTVSLPYQNVDIQKISPNTAITKIQQLTVRIDENYKVLDILKAYQCIDSSGYYSEEPNKKFTNITVTALKPMINSYYKDNFSTVYKWIFKNCYITSISPLEFDYQSPNQGTVNISFVWGDYEEGLFNANEAPDQISANDIRQGLIYSAYDAIKEW